MLATLTPPGKSFAAFAMPTTSSVISVSGSSVLVACVVTIALFRSRSRSVVGHRWTSRCPIRYGSRYRIKSQKQEKRAMARIHRKRDH
ncbi:hypothetical protein-transmembrane region and signal peptide prediction [Rhodopirellula baltica SH 1]|uniref:Uncharacterized protein n=1 Tax=Rhodopirellula baltica (strain DSM 10527 / NCIMB 13988 / SH1) TaxID=243090 RepID=Q7USZ3_RHOBA|nr:hypothetical protein-transmembrane region and signal peptide prediction [Rhodopirellula baltica SH 1]